MIPLDRVYDFLCVRDPRNPSWEVLFGDLEANDLPLPRIDCCCDNCFYSRDPLALEIICLHGKLSTKTDQGEV